MGKPGEEKTVSQTYYALQDWQKIGGCWQQKAPPLLYFIEKCTQNLFKSLHAAQITRNALFSLHY